MRARRRGSPRRSWTGALRRPAPRPRPWLPSAPQACGLLGRPGEQDRARRGRLHPRRTSRAARLRQGCSGERRCRRLRGRRAIASNRPSPCRSSVISQRRGRGWRARIALPIAAAMARIPTERGRGARSPRRRALAGREPDEVTLIAVSKTQPAEAIEALIAAGPARFRRESGAGGAGQVARAARAPSRRPRSIWSASSSRTRPRRRVALFDAIHSLDRPSLVAALARAMAKTGRRPGLLRPGQYRRRAAKGRLPGRRAAGPARSGARGLPVVGLMCIPPDGVEAGALFRPARQAGAASWRRRPVAWACRPISRPR